MLNEITVIDTSLGLPGSYASLLLSDLGAEIVKIERPPDGERSRSWQPQVRSVGHRFLQRNRNKRSVVIDLKTRRGTEAFHALAAESDVIIDGFRPGVMERLGIGYEKIKKFNEEIVYCSVTGFGQHGPYSDTPGHDLNYISVGGLLSNIEYNRRPVIPNIPLGDLSGGLFAAFSILAALIGKNQYGGQQIDLSITDVIFSWNIAIAGEYFGNQHWSAGDNSGDTNKDYAADVISGSYACYNIYETADGEFLAVAAPEEKFWKRFCECIGKESLIEAHRSNEGREQRIEAIQKRIRTRTLEEWMEIFENQNVPCTPVNDIDDAMHSRNVEARKLIETIDFDGIELPQIKLPVAFSEFDYSVKNPPPHLGEDTEAVLSALGYDDEEIKSMEQDSVIQISDN